MRDWAAPVFIEEPAEIIYRCGRFYVTDAAGPRVIERHAFMRNFRRMAEAIQESYAVEGAEVIPLRPDDELLAAH
jgi:hypothetical protein